MSNAASLKFTVKFVDPDLDTEEQDEQAMRLLAELKEMAAVETVGSAVDPAPPEGNKSSGGFVPGVLTGEAEADGFKSVFSYIGDRAAAKNIEMEIERNGRILRVAATNQEDMQTILPLLQQFLLATEQPVQPLVSPRTILILAVQPTETARLRLDEEMRDIQAGLARSRDS
ncbi:MAG: hypothetical protein WA885_24965, partial [Phormidesmis sp.]